MPGHNVPRRMCLVIQAGYAAFESMTFWCNRMTPDRYGRPPPSLRIRPLDSRLTFVQPRSLLCGDAEESLAVQPVARQHG
jgi:hypothetical protein